MKTDLSNMPLTFTGICLLLCFMFTL